MSAFNSTIAAQIVAPSGGDWGVRFVLEPFQIVDFRVSPATLTAVDAVDKAKKCLPRGSRVVEYTAMRMDDPAWRRVITSV